MKDKTLTAGYYVVGFFDILGQKDALRTLSGLPNSSDAEDINNFHRVLKSTYGAVAGFRKMFSAFFDGYNKSRPPPFELTNEQHALLKGMVGNSIKSHTFSDFITVYCALKKDEDTLLPIKSVYGVLRSAAATSLSSLAMKHPVRGALDIGVGIEIDSNEVYGAPLARAYELESTIASYPRIVIGKELLEYIAISQMLEGTDIISVATREIAEACAKLLVEDSDGVVFVDFMGKEILDSLVDPSQMRAVVLKSYDFVVGEYEKFTKNNSIKIANKYSLLKEYMDSRIFLWR